MIDWSEIPDHHPVRRLFEKLTARAFAQTSLTDRDVHRYISTLLLQFMHTDSLYQMRDADGKRMQYLIDMMQEADLASGGRKRQIYQYIGDYTLFMLGMFPENLNYGRRMIPQSYYADTGRRSYRAASQLARNSTTTVVFRKMAEMYDPCVESIYWIREYTRDPFYQYMFRQFGVM